VEQAVQIGVDDRAPVFLAHFAEQAVAGDAGVVDQYVDGTQLVTDLAEGVDRGVPVGNVADRCMEGVAQGSLLVQPLLEIPAGAATGHDGIPFFGQALAYRGSYATHSTGDVSQFFTHDDLL